MIITLTTAGLCGLILLVLSVRVSMGRTASKVSLGDGGDPHLLARIRAQANFVEYVPFILILMGMIEANIAATSVGVDHGPNVTLGVLGIGLVLCRIAHAWGMARPAPNPGRMVGTSGTFLILIVTSVWALIISAHLHHLF
ncbi:MAPEG family protein [Sphingosinicellaceae bacterium]|nr:MAPEG family protein [Sphingosinicellaceae bacterium]